MGESAPTSKISLCGFGMNKIKLRNLFLENLRNICVAVQEKLSTQQNLVQSRSVSLSPVTRCL